MAHQRMMDVYQPSVVQTPVFTRQVRRLCCYPNSLLLLRTADGGPFGTFHTQSVLIAVRFLSFVSVFGVFGAAVCASQHDAVTHPLNHRTTHLPAV